MRLTRKKSIELCILLWSWLAKTGKKKWEWPGWKKYGDIKEQCWFCEYAEYRESKSVKEWYKKDTCVDFCPLPTYCGDMAYLKWHYAKTPRTRKKYAKLFLGQIKKLK